jgi:hypothetical protein
VTYGVRALKVGQVEIPGPELYWMSDWDRWYPLFFNVVLAQGDDVTLLVNTGAPEDLTQINEVWTGIFGERGRYVRSPDETIEAQLARVGVRPEDVTHLVVTPFQLYSTAGIPLFSKAEICLSKRGWVHYHTTHEHPHDLRWSSISEEVLSYLLIDAWERVRLLEDEDEVVPGIRTWWAGTHHRASVAVEIDTAAGPVITSDAFFYYENVEENRILGINENMYEALACYDRVRRVADHIVPLYDPKVFERYSDGVVAPPPD